MIAPAQLQVGGVYASKSDEGFHISKIIVLRDFTAFVLSYRDTFAEQPQAVATCGLHAFYFAPIDLVGFARDVEFINQEEITDAEIKMYQDHLELQADGNQQ